MKSYGYVSVVAAGREVLVPEWHDSLSLLAKEPTFCFVQRYSEEERSERRKHNANLVKELLDNSWEAEKHARRVEQDSLKRTFGKKKKAPKRRYDIPNKEEWKKRFRKSTYKRVETEFPLLKADDIKHPLENLICRDVWRMAHEENVPEWKIDMFFELLHDTSGVHEEAASLLFKVIAADVRRLHDCFCESYGFVRLNGPVIPIEQKWFKDFMKVDIKANGATKGKGELGSLLLFDNLRLDPKGDLMALSGRKIEMKSVSKGFKEIRLGSVKTYSDGETFRKLAENETLRKTQLMKWISWPLINKNNEELVKTFGSIQNLKLSLEDDIRNAIVESQSDVLVYDEESETLRELDMSCISFRSVSKEGRWKFEEKPNKAA